MTSDPRGTWAQLFASQPMGPYRIQQLLGEGEFGLVFEAIHVLTNRGVALKVLPPTATPDVVLEFVSEGALLGQLQKSSNVVEWLESADESVNVTHGQFTLPLPVRYHVLELASGCLQELLLHAGRLQWRDRLSLWRGVVLGVHQMHLHRIVHRDLKSSNCLLFARRRNKVDCKVGDLGRSRDLKSSARLAPEDYWGGRGDLRFAPPEFLWLQGEDTAQAHRSADLYGLGSLLYEVVTGQAVTAMALGIGPDLVTTAAKDVAASRRIDLHTLLPQYELAYQVFAEELPSSIRQQGTRLIRQLCSPDPANRFPQPLGRKAPHSDGLEWLLRQADILLKGLAREPKVPQPPVALVELGA